MWLVLEPFQPAAATCLRHLITFPKTTWIWTKTYGSTKLVSSPCQYLDCLRCAGSRAKWRTLSNSRDYPAIPAVLGEATRSFPSHIVIGTAAPLGDTRWMLNNWRGVFFRFSSGEIFILRRAFFSVSFPFFNSKEVHNGKKE